jgi:hypothetical protein
MAKKCKGFHMMKMYCKWQVRKHCTVCSLLDSTATVQVVVVDFGGFGTDGALRIFENWIFRRTCQMLPMKTKRKRTTMMIALCPWLHNFENGVWGRKAIQNEIERVKGVTFQGLRGCYCWDRVLILAPWFGLAIWERNK